jgi:hypothetical protein
MTRVSSFLDGSPTPAWLVESRRLAEAQQQQPAWAEELRRHAAPRPAVTRKPTRDWLSLQPEAPLAPIEAPPN